VVLVGGRERGLDEVLARYPAGSYQGDSISTPLNIILVLFIYLLLFFLMWFKNSICTEMLHIHVYVYIYG
jgi:hypothetical protein